MNLHIPAPTVKTPIKKPTLEAVLDPHKDTLHPTAKKIFTQLFQTALYVLEAKAPAPAPTQQVIHQPVELVCEALGISRVTFYHHLTTLRRLGLVYSRAHTGNWYGLARKTGTLFSVALKPNTRARIGIEDYRHQWRDLEADTQREGRTAWSFLRGLQSQPNRKEASQKALRSWAVNPGTTNNPVTNDCKGTLSETVYSLEMLSDTHFKDRPKLVDSFAQALAHGFLDSHNLNFWRKLLWDALKRDTEGYGTLHKLTNALTRLMADRAEWQELRSAGALLVHRLKQCGLWDELRHT